MIIAAERDMTLSRGPRPRFGAGVLAGRGLSNRAIAEKLTVSVRTVEGHLYRAGHKLGVSERTELPTVLGIE